MTTGSVANEIRARSRALIFFPPSGAIWPWCVDLRRGVRGWSVLRFDGAVREKILREVDVSVVAGPHHLLARRRSISWPDVGAYPWVFPPLNTVLRAPLERAFERHGLSVPENRIETRSIHVIRSYLQHSDALAVISEDVARYYDALGLIAILPLELPRLVGEIGVVWSRHRPLSPGAEELIDCLERAVRPSASRERQGARRPRRRARAQTARNARA